MCWNVCWAVPLRVGMRVGLCPRVLGCVLDCVLDCMLDCVLDCGMDRCCCSVDFMNAFVCSCLGSRTLLQQCIFCALQTWLLHQSPFVADTIRWTVCLEDSFAPLSNSQKAAWASFTNVWTVQEPQRL